MEKAMDLGKVSAIGGFHLFVGRVISTLVLAIGTIILARVLTPAEYGIYTIALVPSVTLSLFNDWGICQAISKNIAESKASNKSEEMEDLIKVGLMFKIVTGIILSLLSLVLANFIATVIFNRPELSSFITLTSIAIFSDSLLTISNAGFIGFERMEFTSITVICQSILKTMVSPLLVIAGFGALGAVFGYTISFFIAGILGLAILYFKIYKNFKKSTIKTDKFRLLKKLLHYGIPLSASTMLRKFLVEFLAFLMAFYCTDIMIGNYQIAANFALFLTFFSFPITTVLFPAFSKINPKVDQDLLRVLFSSAVKYAALLLVPATMLTLVLSGPMVGTLFGEKWIYAPSFLSLYVIEFFFVLFGTLIIDSFLAGIGETKILFKLSVIQLSVGVTLALILIPLYGITGVILSSLFAGVPNIFVGLYWVWKHYQIKMDFKVSAKIFLAASITTLITNLCLSFLTVADWITVGIGGSIFLIVYLFMAPLLGAVNLKDLQVLRAMFSSLQLISKLINPPLKLMERVASLKILEKFVTKTK